MKQHTLSVFTFLAVGVLFPASGMDVSLATAQSRLAVIPASSTPPPKVMRYAEIVIQRYDANGDRILQQAEWEKMPGTPRMIDLDGDLLITKDELVRHIAQFGFARTIHRTVTLDLSEPYRFDPANLRLFRPLRQRPVTTPPPQEEPVEEPADVENGEQSNH